MVSLRGQWKDSKPDPCPVYWLSPAWALAWPQPLIFWRLTHRVKRAVTKSTEQADPSNLGSPTVPACMVSILLASPGDFSYWFFSISGLGDNLDSGLALLCSSVLSAACYPYNIPAAALEKGASGERMKPGGRWYLWGPQDHILLTFFFCDVWGWNRFQSQLLNCSCECPWLCLPSRNSSMQHLLRLILEVAVSLLQRMHSLLPRAL